MRAAVKLIGGVLLTAPLALSLGLPAGASSGSHLSVASGGTAGAAPAVLKQGNSNVTKANVFKPVKVSGPESTSADCSSTNYSFTIKNNSGASQTVTYGGSALFTFPKKSLEYICADEKLTGTLGLQSNANAVLTFNVRK
jgi:hypothetical protein